MKRKLLSFLMAVLVIATLGCIFTFSASAAETPTVSIDKFNLVFEDNVYLKYAVKFEGVADSEINATNIGMLYFTTPMDDYTKGGEAYSSAVVGYQTIEGQKYYTFEYRHITAKQMTDYIYSIAYIDLDGTRYFSAPVKYSVLDYCYSKLGKTGVASENENFKYLLTATLEQGAAAQKYFEYNTGRLANAEYYLVEVIGGTLEDGFTKGLYHSGETATLTASDAQEEQAFHHWKDEFNNRVSSFNPYTLQSFTSNKIFTSVFEEIKTYSKGLKYTSNNDGTCYVSGIGTCTDTDILIPDVASEGFVTAIGNEAFKDCALISSVTIPQGVEEIKQFAFENCTSLESVNIPDGLLSIGRYAFAGCNSLRKVVIPNSVTVIGSNAFSSCSALESLSIPFVGTSPDATGIQSHIAILFGVKTVTRYDNYLYSVYDSKNYSYTYYTYSLPSSLKNISITGPYKIQKMALQRCYNITNISISNEVASIGSDAFRGCESLTDIVFPVSITNVPTGAFYGADNLKNVYYTGTEAQWEEIIFENNGTYPLTSRATRYYYSETHPTENGNFWHYNENGEIEIWA